MIRSVGVEKVSKKQRCGVVGFVQKFEVRRTCGVVIVVIIVVIVLLLLSCDTCFGFGLRSLRHFKDMTSTLYTYIHNIVTTCLQHCKGMTSTLNTYIYNIVKTCLQHCRDVYGRLKEHVSEILYGFALTLLGHA